MFHVLRESNIRLLDRRHGWLLYSLFHVHVAYHLTFITLLPVNILDLMLLQLLDSTVATLLRDHLPAVVSLLHRKFIFDHNIKVSAITHPDTFMNNTPNSSPIRKLNVISV